MCKFWRKILLIQTLIRPSLIHSNQIVAFHQALKVQLERHKAKVLLNNDANQRAQHLKKSKVNKKSLTMTR